MKRIVKNIAGLVLVFVLVLMTGCGDDDLRGRFTEEQLAEYKNDTQPVLPPVSGGLSLSVGSETIEVEKIVDAMEPKLKAEASKLGYTEFYDYSMPLYLQKIVDDATGLILYEKARKDAGSDLDDKLEKYVETELGKFIGHYGNDYLQAEEAIRQRGLVNWEEFREFKRKELLLTVYYSKQMQEFKPTVTPEQIRAYYNKNIDGYRSEGVMEFMLIDLVPGKLSVEQVKTDEGETKEVAAVRIANELVGELKAGEDFEETAKKYSHGSYAPKGGKWSPRRPGQLAEPWAVLEDTMKKMSRGEVSDPIEVKGHVFVVKLIQYKRKSTEDFNEVRDQIQEILEFEEKMAYVSKISSEQFDAQNLPYLEEFVKACIERGYRKYNVGS